MCQGMGFIVTKSRIYFTMPDIRGNVSHELILELMTERRMITHDDKVKSLFLRKFVRVGYPEWTPESFHIDELKTLPPWADEEDIRARCDKLFLRIKAIYHAYSTARTNSTNEHIRSYAHHKTVELALVSAKLAGKITAQEYEEKVTELLEARKQIDELYCTGFSEDFNTYKAQIKSIPGFLY